MKYQKYAYYSGDSKGAFWYGEITIYLPLKTNAVSWIEFTHADTIHCMDIIFTIAMEGI